MPKREDYLLTRVMINLIDGVWGWEVEAWTPQTGWVSEFDSDDLEGVSDDSTDEELIEAFEPKNEIRTDAELVIERPGASNAYYRWEGSQWRQE